jgi:hypothetical protein
VLGVRIQVKKRLPIVIFAVFTLSFLLHLLTIPTRTGALGDVRVSPGMIQTNSSGSLEVVATVSNAGPNILRIWVGVQANPGGGWVAIASNNSTLTILEPGKETIITNRFPGSTGPWRVFAACQRVYPHTYGGLARTLFDQYLLKKEVHRYYYSTEMK